MGLVSIAEKLKFPTVDLTRQHGNELLTWFVQQEGAKIVRDEFSLSGKKIYRFCNSLSSDKSLSGFGRSQDEYVAAVKACAEAVERQAYQQYIASKNLLTLRLIENKEGFVLKNILSKESINPSFYNSNGWAVGFSKDAAIERAKAEALERHLLLYSFLKSGWTGFFEINRFKFENVELISLVSKYTLAGYSAGIAIAKSNDFKGVSFGYLCDKTENIKTSQKWEQAFYESYDYLRARIALKNFEPESDANSQGLDYYLQNEFDEEFLTRESRENLGDLYSAGAAVIDLKNELGLNFPLFAAVVHGGDLLPLFFKSSLTPQGTTLLQDKFEKMELATFVPERHPIL